MYILLLSMQIFSEGLPAVTSAWSSEFRRQYIVFVWDSDS